MIERDFDVSFVAGMALREKQIQQNYRPVIAVHKWFARRPGTLFRSLLLSEFGDRPLSQAFFEDNDLSGRKVGDPFMGGGTPLLEANRLGCSVVGYDLNPMAWWIVNEELLELDPQAYTEAAEKLRADLETEIGDFYRTRCVIGGDSAVPVKSFLWVKTMACGECGEEVDLFPGMVLAENARHPKPVIVCARCGDLNEVEDKNRPGSCGGCGDPLRTTGNVARGLATCPHCGGRFRVPGKPDAPFSHRLFGIEYHNPRLRSSHRGRFFKKPDEDDLTRLTRADSRWKSLRARFVPDDEIPGGDETDRLHRWGYRKYREMFHPRQLLGLELSARHMAQISDERVRRALATNLSDLLRYQNQLCRYDARALKVLDIFSVHGFPVGFVHAEANFLGLHNPAGAPIGSGGWNNIIEKYRRAKAYCDHPFEIRHNGKKKTVITMKTEYIGGRKSERLNGRKRTIRLECGDATEFTLAADSLDAVLTDPPYYGNVQYAELVDFCYVWLRKLAGKDLPAFAAQSTRHLQELTENETLGRGLESFADGLSQVYRRMGQALKPGHPFVFTFHHNKLEAYLPVAVAILDAGLACTAAIPAPAEMGASIHINGTGSSIIDTVFVCRSTGWVKRSTLADSAKELAVLAAEDLERLRAGGVKPTKGDTRCIVYGHMARLAIWHCRQDWDHNLPAARRLDRVRTWLFSWGTLEEVISHMEGRDDNELELLPLRQGVGEEPEIYSMEKEYEPF